MSVVYRTCEFEGALAVALDTYRKNLNARHAALVTSADGVRTTTGRMTTASTIRTRLLALMRLYGISSIDAFRKAVGLRSGLKSQEDFELWVLEYLGLAFVNGIYVAQGSGSVKIAPYRTLYKLLGLSVLEAACAAAQTGDYAFYMQHDGLLYSDVTPRTLEARTGLAFSEFETTFVWFGGTNKQARALLRTVGFPADELYRVVRAQDSTNISTILLPRLDFFSKLREMGYTTADITALLERDIAKVLIDSQRNRPDDAITAITGVYQPTPYPGELAADLRQKLSTLPPVGQIRASSGARTFMSPHIAVMRCLDPARSFDTRAYIAALADTKKSTNNSGSQAILAMIDAQAAAVLSTYATVKDTVVAPAVDAAETTENIWAFFGFDIGCGRSDPAGWPKLGKLSGPLLDQIQLGEVDLADIFSASVGAFTVAGTLSESLLGALDTLTCGAVSLDCTASAGSSVDSDGGAYDEDGTILNGMMDAQSVMACLNKLTSGAYGAFGDFANALYSAGQLASIRDAECTSDSSIIDTQTLMSLAGR